LVDEVERPVERHADANQAPLEHLVGVAGERRVDETAQLFGEGGLEGGRRNLLRGLVVGGRGGGGGAGGAFAAPSGAGEEQPAIASAITGAAAHRCRLDDGGASGVPARPSP